MSIADINAVTDGDKDDDATLNKKQKKKEETVVEYVVGNLHAIIMRCRSNTQHYVLLQWIANGRVFVSSRTFR